MPEGTGTLSLLHSSQRPQMARLDAGSRSPLWRARYRNPQGGRPEPRGVLGIMETVLVIATVGHL